MRLGTYTIDRPATETRKGRQFASELVAVAGDELAPGKRPAWMAWLGSPTANRWFIANLLAGERAVHNSDRVALTKRGYARRDVRVGEEAVLTLVYYRELFHADPGLIGPEVEFVLLPTRAWYARQAISDAQAQADAERAGVVLPDRCTPAEFGALAALAWYYVDRRVREPMPRDTTYSMLLLDALLETRAARWVDLDHVAPAGLGPGLTVQTSATEIGQVLATCTRRWYVGQPSKSADITLPLTGS